MSESVSEAAKTVLEIMKRQYQSSYTIVPVVEKDFSHLDLSRYHAFRAGMEAGNFAFMSDLEILEVSQSPTSVIARTMIRSMLSRDGTINAGYYQIKPHLGRRLKLLLKGLKNLRLIDAPKSFLKSLGTKNYFDFETELSDGTFLVTTNIQPTISNPPTVETHYLPYATPASAMLQFHQQQLEETLKKHATISPKPMSGLQDILAMQKRQRDQKTAYRATVQWITQSELQKMSGGNPELANAIFNDIQKLQEG